MGLASILCAIEESSSSLKRKDAPSLFTLPLPVLWKKVMVEAASSHGGKCHDGNIHLRPQIGKHGVVRTEQRKVESWLMDIIKHIGLINLNGQSFFSLRRQEKQNLILLCLLSLFNSLL